MKKIAVLLSLAVLPLLLTSSQSEARGRRRCTPCPVVCCPPCPCVSPVPIVQSAPLQQFVSPKGRVYRFSISQEPQYEFETRAPAGRPNEAPPGPDDYVGNDRGKAKTSIASAPIEAFDDLGKLLDDVVEKASDQFMRMQHDPKLKRDFDFDRVMEEKRNVTVPVWLYAIKKEANDNDYHLITGSDPAVAPIRYMNMEVTGLPLGGPNRPTLRVPREALKQFLGDHNVQVTTNGYFRFEDPVPARVTGSLFYDIDHLPGVVGSFTPAPKRVPATAWEVHPITDIVFEP